jgi:hypothetical protein
MLSVQFFCFRTQQNYLGFALIALAEAIDAYDASFQVVPSGPQAPAHLIS